MLTIAEARKIQGDGITKIGSYTAEQLVQVMGYLLSVRDVGGPNSASRGWLDTWRALPVKVRLSPEHEDLRSYVGRLEASPVAWGETSDALNRRLRINQ